MEEVGCYLVGIVAAIIAVVALVLYALAFVYCLLCGLGFIILVIGDYLFSARLFSSAPYIGYLLVGGLIGGTLGFWTIAPAYGLRKARPMIIATPLIIAGILFLITASMGTATIGFTSALRSNSTSSNSLASTWHGNHGSILSATMNLTQTSSTSTALFFEGTITGINTQNQETELKVKAKQNLMNRNVSISEISVNRSDWKLGENTGILSADGQSMSGTGKDGKNPPYKWNYRRN